MPIIKNDPIEPLFFSFYQAAAIPKPPTNSNYYYCMNRLFRRFRLMNFTPSTVDRVWLFGQADSVNATLDLFNPTVGGNQAILKNAPTFTAGKGFKGNGTSSYIDTGFVPFVNGTTFLQNSNSCGVYLLDNIDETASEFGVTNAGHNLIQLNARQGNTLYYYNQDTSIGSGQGAVACTDSLGYISTARPDSTHYSAYKRGVVQQTVTRTSEALANGNVFALGRNIIGTGMANPSTKTMGFFYLGGSSIDQLKVNFAIQEYFTGIKTAV